MRSSDIEFGEDGGRNAWRASSPFSRTGKSITEIDVFHTRLFLDTESFGRSRSLVRTTARVRNESVITRKMGIGLARHADAPQDGTGCSKTSQGEMTNGNNKLF